MMIEHRAYCWQDQNGGWQVGKPLPIDGEIQTRYCPGNFGLAREVAMQPSHAGRATWVRVDELQPYPLKPIEEPIVKGGA